MRAQDLTFLSNVSQIDWARLAAYIDGEGCIRITANKGKYATSRRVFYLELTVTNTDVRLLDWLRQTFGGSVFISGRVGTQKHRSTAYAWVIASRHAATVIEYCLPYFIIKREQADVALAFQRTILPDRRYGVKGRPQALVDEQAKLHTELQTLKGTSSRAKRPAVTSTIQ